MYSNTVHRWFARLILRLSGAFLGCAGIVAHAGEPSSAASAHGFMARGLAQRTAAAGNVRPDFALPLTGGAKDRATSLTMEECEEEDEVQAAAAVPQQAPVLAVAAPSLATPAAPQAGLPAPARKEDAALVAPPPAPAPEWELAPSDKTLNAALKRWATIAGWQLVWEFPHDYEIDVRSTIHGTFEDAIDAVARNAGTAETPMRAIFYKGNKVLRIVAKGRE